MAWIKFPNGLLTNLDAVQTVQVVDTSLRLYSAAAGGNLSYDYGSTPAANAAYSALLAFLGGDEVHAA
jgi:hypothetical protein